MLVTERFHLPKTRYANISSEFSHQFGFNGFGEATYYRTYSRNDLGPQEHWLDTCVRSTNGVFSIRKDWYKKMGLHWRDEDWYDFATRMLQLKYQMKFLPPGRGLSQMGAPHVYEIGSMALNNCALTAVKDDTWIQDLGWSMDALMCGAGVGYRLLMSAGHLHSVLRPRNPEITRTCTIGDSREGWIESVELLLVSFVKGETLNFDYHQVRPFGSPIKRFGGVSSGPAPLIICHRRIVAYLNNFMAGLCSQTRVLADIINAIGQCVVSGNVRRGAQIILGDLNDKEFLELKSPAVHATKANIMDSVALVDIQNAVFDKAKDMAEWYNYKGTLELLEASDLPDEAYLSERLNISGLSNNSVALTESDDFLGLPTIAEGIRTNGEPGFLNLINIAKYGRFGQDATTTSPSFGLRLDQAIGCNPCGEIPLEDKELCNLVELFPTRCSSVEEFMEAAKFATFYAQTVSLLPTHRPETNAVVSRNRRIGVSLSGGADWLDQIGAARMTRILRDGYKLVVELAANLASASGVPSPIRHTTMKPSGTISQLAGVSPGMHFPTFPFAIRRIRIAADSPMDRVLRKAGYPVEPDAKTPGTSVFEFPIDQGKTRKATEVTLWEQLAFKAMLEREWADNMVSCTAYFNPETEAHQLEHALGQFAPLVKSMSMLPHTEDGAYPQMPYQEISEHEYHQKLKVLGTVDWSKYSGTPENAAAVMYCENDRCVIV